MNRKKIINNWELQKKLFFKYLRIIYISPAYIKLSKNFTVRFIKLSECMPDYIYKQLVNELDNSYLSEEMCYTAKGVLETIKLIKTNKNQWCYKAKLARRLILRGRLK